MSGSYLDEMTRMLSTLASEPTIERRSDGTVSYTWTATPQQRPLTISADRHNKEVLAFAVAEALGVPSLSEQTKDDLYEAVLSFFTENPDAE